MDDDKPNRGQMGLKNGQVSMNTPEQMDQRMQSECPHCGFHCQRVLHPRTRERLCPHCLESVGPAFMAA